MTAFDELVFGRRMTRAFRPDPVAPEVIEHLVALAARAPSAGKTQGWDVVVLVGEQTARLWDVTLPSERRATFGWPDLLVAPVIMLPFANPDAYLERYSEVDKRASGLGVGVDAWTTPYWTVDASMAMMTILLGAQDVGLGALLFGVFDRAAELLEALSVPSNRQLLGAVALGYPGESPARPGRSAGRPTREPSDIIHWGGW